MKPLAFLLVSLLALAPVACDNAVGLGVEVDNRTAQELHVQVQLHDTSWKAYPGVAPAHQTSLVLPASVMPESGCSFGPMVALDAAHSEVARHDEPVCVGDVWVIE